MKISAVLGLLSAILFSTATGQQPWLIESSADWTGTEASATSVVVKDGAVVIDPTVSLGTPEGQFTSKWHDWQKTVDSAEVRVEAELDLFDKKKIEVIVKGSDKPYTDADGVEHDWYGRCMIAILDENRWIMTFRSGVNHIEWGKRDTIHLITTNDEGRTWSGLNRWFDGTPIKGMPYEDGNTHSEPGIYRMPNGDLILQFWKASAYKGTKQFRSTDNGKTWTLDSDRIRVVGVTGADDDRAIGTQGYFADPENPSDVYMAFQYYHSEVSGDPIPYNGTILARSRDNGKTYEFLSWMTPLEHVWEDGNAKPTNEPAIEYVGNRTIVALFRCGKDAKTWQGVSTDMGESFSPRMEISDQINGGVSNGLWQRARLYKESNPFFQYGNPLDFTKGEGRLWGFGIHSNGGGYTRKPVVYWSDDNGKTWNGPESLHGPLQPGTDTGYGDLKRRTDGTFVAATYYANRDSTVADVEQYTFGGERAKVIIEVDRDGDGEPDAASPRRELHGGSNVFTPSVLKAGLWRFKLILGSPDAAESPKISSVKITPH